MSNFRRDDNRSIYDVVEDMVDASGKNRREIAVEIGKEYSTLRRELNPYDEGAKLGAELLLPLMRSTGRKDIAEWFALKVDCRLECIEVTPDKPTIQAECLDTYPAIIDFHQAIQRKEPLLVVSALLRAAIEELEQDFVAYREESSK